MTNDGRLMLKDCWGNYFGLPASVFGHINNRQKKESKNTKDLKMNNIDTSQPLLSTYYSFDSYADDQKLTSILTAIKEGKYQDTIEEYRYGFFHEKDTNTIQQQIPLFTPSGTFEKGHSAKKERLIDYSQLIALEIKLNQAQLPQLTVIKEQIIRISYTYACFLGASGNSLHILVHTHSRPSLHQATFHEVKDYYQRQLNSHSIVIEDNHPIDLLIQYSYDPNLYHSVNSFSFPDISHYLGKYGLVLAQKAVTSSVNKPANDSLTDTNITLAVPESDSKNKKSSKPVDPIKENNDDNKEKDNTTSPESTITPELIQDEIDNLNSNIRSNEQEVGILLQKGAAEWIEESKKRPQPERIFGDFWFESEICILFADTNVGKSILAVQIADSISTGISIKGFPSEVAPQKVLYLDFELSDKQFEARYSNNYKEHYQFDSNLLRVEINPEASIPEGLSFEESLNQSVEELIQQTGSRILIIDNITYLRNETERAKEALPLMKHLKAIQKKYQLSILVLAHTPKRDQNKPLNKNDLQGSKMLINFCDSCFAIGESMSDKGIRYLKQLKQRNVEAKYDSDNICVCHIHKPHNFLGFEFLDFGNEQDYLQIPTQHEKQELETQVRYLLKENPEISSYAIAKQLQDETATNFNSFKVKVNRLVKKIKANSCGETKMN